MSEQSTNSSRRILPMLLLLFVGSGCAALIYEIVWFQLLQLSIGSSAVSLGAILATFMGGMCLGSILLPKKISSSEHPLRVYAKIEIGIGILGFIVLFLIPIVDRLYASVASGLGLNGVFFRAIVAAICLIPPTLLMGASLPAMARWIQTTREGVSWLGFFYGGNIAGAVFGCLLAGFYLLRVYDMAVATYVAVAINLVVGIAGLALAKAAPYTPPAKPVNAEPVAVNPHAKTVFLVIGISGMCALGAEVIWTRLLALMMGATVYTFSIILAVFLVGLGIGSAAGSMISRSVNPRAALGWCQMFAALCIGWTAYNLADSLPYWPINPLLSTSPWFNFQIDLMRAFWAVLPPALMWGASFPLALSAASTPGQDPGRLAGETYAANTLGAIFGSILFSVVFIPWLGTKGSQQILMFLAMAGGVTLLIQMGRATMAWLGAAVMAMILLIANLDPVPWLTLAYGRRATTTIDAGQPLSVGEGMNSSIVVSQLPGGQRYFHVSGKVEASTEPFDMRLQRMLGHLSALVHKDPHSVLIVGFGAGVTAGSFTQYPSINKIDICEIEKLIPPTSTQYFNAENYNVMNDTRTTIHYDDARHFILTTPQKFDIITSDPIHPWVKGAATLYSKEYFELAKQHLNPGGVITQWVPLYESDPDTVRSEIATFFDVFPNGTIWANNNGGEGYDTVLLGQVEPTKIDMDALQQRLNRPDYPRVVKSLSDVGFNKPSDLMGTYLASAADLKSWLEGSAINRDLNLRLQYLAGMGVNSQSAGYIEKEIGQRRTFPKNIFAGSDQSLADLTQVMQSQ